jgi:hypothetical protein
MVFEHLHEALPDDTGCPEDPYRNFALHGWYGFYNRVGMGICPCQLKNFWQITD